MNEPKLIDLIVIGGGINGRNSARCGRRGLSVVLSEKDDLAEGTSSALRQAGARRPALSRILRIQAGARGADRTRSVAQCRATYHLADALRAAAQPGRSTGWLVRLGLFLYDHLGVAGSCRYPTLNLARDPEGAPILDQYERGSNIPTAGWTTPAWSR